MKHKYHINHLWLVLGTYGVWFAIFSGAEDFSAGKYWKAISCLILGIATYIAIENYIKNKA